MNHHRQRQSGELYLQGWLLLVSLCGFGMYVLIDLNLLPLLWRLDRSYMASLALGLLLLATVHCGWHLVASARKIRDVDACLHAVSADPDIRSKKGPENDSKTASNSDAPAGSTWLADLQSLPISAERAREQLIEVTADAIRSPVELGWYFVDLAIRLGLLGTIIGFILIFGSLDSIRIEGSEDLKGLLIAMSGGMGTALLTTLTGLLVASLLGLQYLILGRASETLISRLIHLDVRQRPVQMTASEPPLTAKP